MVALDASEDRIEAERVERSIAAAMGDCACVAAPNPMHDRARQNLALLYGGASRPFSPAFGRVSRGQEASGDFASR